MLDIGCGDGILSLYAAWKGAKQVIGLEPELAGSTKGVLEKFKHQSELLALDNVSIKPLRFQDYQPKDVRFDIILLHNSINHLDEQACINLRIDPSGEAIL